MLMNPITYEITWFAILGDYIIPKQKSLTVLKMKQGKLNIWLRTGQRNNAWGQCRSLTRIETGKKSGTDPY